MFGVSFMKRDCLLLSFRLLPLKQMGRVTQTGQIVMGKREENGKITRRVFSLPKESYL